MKKVIKQESNSTIRIDEDNVNGIFEIKIKQLQSHPFQDIVIIEKSKAREVALAICPELESELKEAVELIELYIEKSTRRENGMVYINDFELFEKFNAFLTKHKSKE